MMLISEQEVYNTLTYHWQRTREVRNKIAEERGKEIYPIAIAPVLFHLDSLANQGFVEMNEREPTEEEAAVIGNNSISEFRKISGKEPAYDGLEKVADGDLGLVTA